MVISETVFQLKECQSVDLGLYLCIWDGSCSILNLGKMGILWSKSNLNLIYCFAGAISFPQRGTQCADLTKSLS